MEFRGLLSELLKWCVGFSGGLIVQGRVAVKKGATTYVLSTQPDGYPGFQEGCIRQCLGESPVDGLGSLAHGSAPLENRLGSGVKNKPFG